MNNKNPYLSILILWIVVSCFSLSSCIFGIVRDNLWQAFFNLALVIVDCVYLGLTIDKFIRYEEFKKSAEQFNEYINTLIEKEKANDNEPFEEFKGE
jgi:hypothetical protein